LIFADTLYIFLQLYRFCTRHETHGIAITVVSVRLSHCWFTPKQFHVYQNILCTTWQCDVSSFWGQISWSRVQGLTPIDGVKKRHPCQKC